jgi:hypothetical protein
MDQAGMMRLFGAALPYLLAPKVVTASVPLSYSTSVAAAVACLLALIVVTIFTFSVSAELGHGERDPMRYKTTDEVHVAAEAIQLGYDYRAFRLSCFSNRRSRCARRVQHRNANRRVAGTSGHLI